MKAIFPICRTLAVLLMAGTAFTACSSDENILSEQQETQAEKQVYTMTVQATKGDAQTRGLSLDDKTLKVKWNKGEEVYVVQDQQVLGVLTATPNEDDPKKATLSGVLNIAPTHQSNLIFYLHNCEMDYKGQTGVLLDEENSIEKKYDYAMAIAYWDTSGEFIVDKENKTVSVPGGVDFQSLQSIVKFTLLDDEGNPLKAKSLTVEGIRHPGNVDVENICQYSDYKSSYNSYIEGPLTITPASATDEIYVAIKWYWMQNIELAKYRFMLTAVDENGLKYKFENKDVRFDDGKFYSITVKMIGPKVKLDNLTEAYTAKDGDILTGTLKEKVKISIEPGATVTLSDLTIEGSIDEYGNEYHWAGITCEGDATIVLKGTNAVKGFQQGYPGIYVPEGKTLTIKGDGELDASNHNQAAGIGAGNEMACGNIVIEGGTITATGGSGAPGIGGAGSAKCGDITITGGTITATGGQSSPGIGAGDQATCGNITITNGVTKVEAKGGYMAYYSIGLGATSKGCGTITIGGILYYDGTNYLSEALQNALKAKPFIYPAE